MGREEETENRWMDGKNSGCPGRRWSGGEQGQSGLGT